MNTAQVIPFRFDAREVRTLLIDDQPWFFAVDVCAALALSHTHKALLGLDDDEKREQEQYSGSGRKPVLINESGLYSLVLRSRKAEAKRFKKWVTAEVLPAIRKHGHYHDSENQLSTLIGQTIGTDGFHVLGALIKGKVACLPATQRRSATSKLWSQTHTAFGVRCAADIPAEQLDAARNFIAAYAIEGEWLGKDSSDSGETFSLTHDQAQALHLLLHSVDWVNFRWHQGIGKGVSAINRPLYASTFEHVDNMARAGRSLDKQLTSIRQHFSHLGGKRPSECAQPGPSSR